MLVNERSQPKPWSALQRDATNLGTDGQGRLHVEGVRWDIVNNADGSAREEGVFGDAYVNPDGLKDIYLAIKPFTNKPGGYPGHAQLHFEFRPDSPVTDSQGHSDRELVLSVEVHFRQGENYEPGGQDPDPIVYQLGTGSDAVEKATLYHHYPLELYKLNLNQDQKVALLRERVSAATLDHTQDIYHPTKNSCLSTLIDGVNLVVPEKQQISHSDPKAKIPVWCPKVFKKYDLVFSTEPDLTIPAVPK